MRYCLRFKDRQFGLFIVHNIVFAKNTGMSKCPLQSKITVYSFFNSKSKMDSLQIYNSLTRSKQVFKPIEPGKVRMYVCGMTIYDYCHIGHARMMMSFDVVYRWLKALGYQVTYVRNITDIDDKIINRAGENGETISSLTERFTRYMHEDTGALGILPPDHEPRATEYVPEMLELIGKLEKTVWRTSRKTET